MLKNYGSNNKGHCSCNNNGCLKNYGSNNKGHCGCNNNGCLRTMVAIIKDTVVAITMDA